VPSQSILIIDDEKSIRQSLKGILNDEGYQALLAEDGPAGLELASRENPDLVLLDVAMPGMDGTEVLANLKKSFPFIPVIIMTGHGSIDLAVRAIKMGSYDFLEKPLEMDKLLLTVQNALNFGALQRENYFLKQKIEKQYAFIGNSAPIKQLRQQIEQAAPTDAWVLIFGENGSGKEIVAREIHRLSTRKEKPFVEVNCAAIPDELIESELFGHEKGAFTGATSMKRGKFDTAHEGTIFLDEIADMSLKTQAKILRILEEQRFERVGGNKTIQVNVRVIAATNKNLEAEIAKGNFREDLYFRLNVIPFTVPPLRERKDDIALLSYYFLRDFTENRGRKRKTLDAEAIAALEAYPWPGNVRELRNIMERLSIMAPTSTIGLKDLPPEITRDSNIPDLLPVKEEFLTLDSIKDAVASFERDYIVEKLRENNGNISKTAEKIGIARRNLTHKIKSYAIDMAQEGIER
jgi:two-component system nitrogen regulation response regulator NtrX